MTHKSQFYRKGVYNQKKHDLIFHIGRPEVEQIKKYDDKTKAELKQWVERAERVFNVFKSEVLESLK